MMATATATAMAMGIFFSLPGEIRHQIWEYCILSPTRCIEPVSRNKAFYRGFPRSTSASGPHFYLCIDYLNSNTDYIPIKTQRRFISLSLPRTCRQIYTETSYLFWNENAFLFSSPNVLLNTFRCMGEIPSRCITSICLSPGPIEGNVLEIFGSAIQLLVKRGSRSSLRRLDLAINLRQLSDIMTARSATPASTIFGCLRPDGQQWYDSFLRLMGEASQGAFEKRLIILSESVEKLAEKRKIKNAYCMAFERDTTRELHFALGGQVLWGADLIWEDFEWVGGAFVEENSQRNFAK